MNLLRELPPEYLENCPIIDEKYKVLFRLGTGRFSKYNICNVLESEWEYVWQTTNELPWKSWTRTMTRNLII